MSYKMKLMWYNKENFENEGYDISAILDNSICFWMH